MAWLRWLGSKAGLALLGLAGALISLATLLRRAERRGMEAQRARELERTVRNVEVSQAARREVAEAHRRGGDPPERVRKFYVDDDAW